MNEDFRLRFLDSRSVNLKSKSCPADKNQKWLGIITVGIAFAMCGARVEAQPKKVPQLGYLSSVDAATESVRSESIRLALRKLGYIEGQNVTIAYRYAEGKVDRAPELAAELVGLKVDIIVVPGGTPWIQAAKNATKTIPIVMVGAGNDPVEAGLIESLARPGGNITGVTRIATQLGGRRLELFKEAVPKLARVAVLYVPTNAAGVSEVKQILPVVARALGLTINLGRYEPRTVSMGFLLRWAISARMDSMCRPAAS